MSTNPLIDPCFSMSKINDFPTSFQFDSNFSEFVEAALIEAADEILQFGGVQTISYDSKSRLIFLRNPKEVNKFFTDIWKVRLVTDGLTLSDSIVVAKIQAKNDKKRTEFNFSLLHRKCQGVQHVS